MGSEISMLKVHRSCTETRTPPQKKGNSPQQTILKTHTRVPTRRRKKKGGFLSLSLIHLQNGTSIPTACFVQLLYSLSRVTTG